MSNYTGSVKIPRVELHAHSEYSNTKNLDCINKLKDLINTANDMGFSGIAITDHECLSGHIQALEIEKEIQKTNPNFKVILGNEIYLVTDREPQAGKKYYHFILLAKNAKGHEYIRKLSSRAWETAYWERGQHRTATLYSDIEEIVKEQDNLIASTACIGGYFPSMLAQYFATGDYEYKIAIDDFLNWGIKIFGQENFFIELQSAITQEQIDFNKKAYEIAKCYGLKCIITDDAHYLHKQDRKIHEAFLSSREAEREMGEFYEACYLKTDEDMIERMPYFTIDEIEEMCQNTVDIANGIEHFSLMKDVEVPNRKLPSFELKHIFKEYYPLYEYINKFAYSDFIQDKFLLSEIEKGFLDKNQSFNETNLKKIDTELCTLWKVSEKLHQRLSAYYNLTQEVINLMWDEEYGNSLVGVSRGSSSGFYICYLMNIVQLNPIEHNLCEWRHLHPERPELPDIDTDSESNKRERIIEGFARYYGEDRVLNIASFKTESSKSAMLTSARGLGVPLEEAQEIADMIPVHRGKAYTIHECLYGDDDEKKPVRGFESLVNSYGGLLDLALGIEGIVSGVTIHASGLYIFNSSYVNQNSLMRSPNGVKITCWNMSDSDKAGALKIDILTIENLDTIRTVLQLLQEDGLIQWQGSLRATYNKYLHPDVLDYTTKEMWDMLNNGKATDIFQLSTDVGHQACNLIKPHSLKEASLTNSIMRLSGDGTELPLQKYKRFHDDISLWYKEMSEAGLNEDEVKILEKYLLENSGLACEQEDVMLLVQDAQIANFTMGEANKLRKGISKKKQSIIEDCKNMFYANGKKAGTRKEFLDYIWDKQINLSLGYSFSRNHTCPYSCIGLQQLNLLYHYPSVYSYTANLCIASSSEEGNESSAIDYGAIAKTISKIKKIGVEVELPDINKAQKGCKPEVPNNAVLFNLKGISNINSEAVDCIISNRPYTDFDDFMNKNKDNLGTVQIINLIKAGCFDNLEAEKTREQLMQYYVMYLTKQEKAPKEKVTASNLQEIIDLKLIAPENDRFIRYYNFNKDITKKENVHSKVKNKTWLLASGVNFTFFEQNYADELTEETDFFYSNEGIVFSKTAYNKIYSNRMDSLLSKLNTAEFIEKYNKKLFAYKCQEKYDKYCQGTKEDWEMDAVSFYGEKHALADINYNKYNLCKFEELPEEPVIQGSHIYMNKTWYEFQLSRICGTVLENDRTKHTVTILTPDGEVVPVKFYAGQFINYNKKITETDEKGKKVVKENSWLARGRKLVLVGYRRGDQFVPKVYRSSIYPHSVALITKVFPNGEVSLTTLRYGEKEKFYNK